MDHQHFEKKLLNEEQMTPEENRALQSHLHDCAICSALADANLALGNVTMVTPAPGFTNRFTARLAARRKAQKRRYFYGGLILLLSGTGLLLWFSFPTLSVFFSSPVTLLSTWASFIVSTISFLRVFSEVGRVLLNVATGFIPTSTLGFSLSLFSILGMLLIASSQKLFRQIQRI
ncbi:MAG: hypothetical protein HN736_04950 [Anaerolineae bacterium]|mgnify:CR=1 FL=1|jgi:hypothetical protein|nr:hypothetical protein [Anaerolineae bacterium]MBT4310085.1 hypothetical protein [Anaerolineae bacterium]MBT4457624.1 hypothetical protein [Anaerolineae bacterium]MBT4841119.1 hypothetical protein [Anaerolineae bacterium]MBT6062310.1 hypothetical protein [Anaerolineae bacterium]